MFENVGTWLANVPLANPWRAIVMVAIVLALAVILHVLWELAFFVGGRVRQFNSRLSNERSRTSRRLDDLARSRAMQSKPDV